MAFGICFVIFSLIPFAFISFYLDYFSFVSFKDILETKQALSFSTSYLWSRYVRFAKGYPNRRDQIFLMLESKKIYEESKSQPKKKYYY